jgi:Rha family phage regulatory protein
MENTNQLVKLDNGKPLTTSLIIAEAFEKEHYNVMRDIRKIIEACGDQKFTALNFEGSSYMEVVQ